MKNGRDIDNRQAENWKAADLSKIKSISDASNRKQLAESIKKVAQNAVNCVYGDAKDTKYKMIVNLIMLRINSELAAFPELLNNPIQIDEDFANSINQQLIAQNFDDSTPYDEFASKLIDVISQTYSSLSTKEKSKFSSLKITLNVEAIAKPTDETNEDDQQYVEALTSKKPLITTNVRQLNFKKIQKSIDEAFTKISLACAYPKTTEIKLKKTNAKAKLTKTTIIEKTTKSQTSLAKKIVPTKSFAKIAKNASQDDGNDERLPDDILQNNIYKYNKRAFKGISSDKIVALVKLADEHKKTNESLEICLGSFSAVVATRVDVLVDSANRILKLIKPNIFKKMLDQIWDFAKKKILKPLKSKIWDLLKPLMPKWLSTAWAFVKSFFKAMWAIFKMLFRVLKRVSKWIFRTAKTMFSKFMKLFKPVIDAIKNGLSKAYKFITQGFQRLGHMIWDGIKAVGKLAWGAIKGVGRWLKNSKVGKAIGKIASKVGQALGKVGQALGKMTGKVGQMFSKAKNFLKNGLNKLKNTLKNAAKKAVKAVKDAIVKVAKKVFNVVKGTIKKIAAKIMQRLGKVFAKKAAKKAASSALKMGMKKLINFAKKWINKIIKKVAMRMLSAMGINAIPGIGQIISAIMMIYTIVDTICMFYDVYKFFKENPPVWNMVKEQVAEWAAKAFDFVGDLLKTGKALFRKIFIEGPKKLAKMYAHAWNMVLNPFSSVKKMMTSAKYTKELDKIKDANLAKFRKMPMPERQKFFKENNEKIFKGIDTLRPKADELTKKIEEEQNSWWPNNKKITAWLDARQDLFKQMMDLATQIGLTDFSKDTCDAMKNIFEQAQREQEQKAKIAKELAKHRKELALKYKNTRIDIEELQKICKKYCDDQANINNEMTQFSKNVANRSNALMTQLESILDGEDEEDNANNSLQIIAM